MNNCGERLKNGIITENPIFRPDAGYVSYSCGNNFSY